MISTLVLEGNRIWTGRRYVEHVIVEGGRVTVAGAGDAPGRNVPTGSERIRVGSHLVVPAFVDPHVHFGEAAVQRHGVDLRGTRSWEEIGARISEWATRHPRALVFGGGWDEEQLVERSAPTAEVLDRYAGDRPVALHRICTHSVLLNSVALTQLGIDEKTPDPPGGSIDRDSFGRPTGRLRESALTILQRCSLPSLRDRPVWGMELLRDAAARGVAAVGSMRIDPEELQWAIVEGGSGVRGRSRWVGYGAVRSLGDIDRWSAERRRHPSLLRGVKFVVDGSLGARSAWLESPYRDEPSTAGGPSDTPGSLEDRMGRADREDLQISVHAIGDRALRMALRGFEAVRVGRTPRIEHASLVPESLLRPLRESAADVVIQPGFRRSDSWLEARLGPERAREAYRFADMLNAGLRLAGSSDAPVEPLDPLDGIRCATDPASPGQALTPAQALALYGRSAASTLGWEDLGHLEAGAAASFVVLETDRIEALAGPCQIREVWMDGERVPGRRVPGAR